ncbi:hypothetical protein EVAR_100636_1 [Eumeta japonica]|uniref:Uncharacterized protein n=1 Tax=Eumeta variegata TaxID=151549 RepID=A0A4C2A4D0_EUMVA|nr:hypothetical protein EVAR_100636_1 [Eumeta japonica]
MDSANIEGLWRNIGPGTISFILAFLITRLQAPSVKTTSHGSSLILTRNNVKFSNQIKGLFSRNLKLMTAQTIRNLKLAPQRVERATVAVCSHLTDIAENLIYDAAAPCILIGQDNWA